MKRGVRRSLSIFFVLFIGTTCLAQPTVVTEVPQASTNFVAAGDFVYFTIGTVLWRTDATASGTIQLAEGFNQGHQWQFDRYGREFNGDFIFLNSNSSEIWRSDGTPGGTVLLETSSMNDISILGISDNYLYFSASDPATGRELYRTDGTPAGTILLKDINPGTADGFRGYQHIVGDQLFFAGNDGTHGTELWKTDGTSAGTVMVQDINPGSANGFPSNDIIEYNTPQNRTYAFNGEFYFRGNSPDTGMEPWVSDGTPEGTRPIDINVGPEDSGPVQYGVANDGLLYFLIFSTEAYDYSGDLYKTAGSEATTSHVKSFPGNFDEQYFHDFVVYQNKVYFWVRRSFYSDNLWVTDGTQAGTHSFFSVVNVDGALHYFDVVNDYMLFYTSNQAFATHFYRSDGTADGTMIFAEHNSRAYSLLPRDHTTVGEMVFYGDHDGLVDETSGYPYDGDDYFNLKQADGETSASMRTLWGLEIVDVANIEDFNGKVVFTGEKADGPETNYIWFYDPAVQPPPSAKFTLVNASTDKDVKRLLDSSLVVNPNQIPLNIRYDPIDTPGSVVFTLNGSRVRVETQAPYALAGDSNGDYNAWAGALPGSYVLTATPYSQAGGTGTPGEPLTITFEIRRSNNPEPPADCEATGTILREHWANVSGATVPAIPVTQTPTSTSQLTLFEGPANIGTNYGARIRGYVCPPLTGNYTFWIASNDHSELWLSTDDNPSNKVRIANLTRATNPREWDKFPSQKSEPIRLVAGQRYYIEALHKQGVGGDHIAVGWQLPNGNLERPITGNRLSPFEDSGTSPCDDAGSILREYWTSVQGARVSDIPLMTSPSGSQELTSFSTPSMGTNYGSRIRGYICPPASGEYVFYISSNDQSELWLSDDDNPAGAQRIAWLTAATNPDQWDKFATQRSVRIPLQQGQLYYVEALHKQGIGSDHFTVAWSLPDNSFQAPVPGSVLVPFDPTADLTGGDNLLSALGRMAVYPNPASSDQMELTISGYDGVSERIESEVEIISISGDIVFRERISCGGDCSSYLLRINQQLVPGLYLVNMKAKGVRTSKRLLVK